MQVVQNAHAHVHVYIPTKHGPKTYCTVHVRQQEHQFQQEPISAKGAKERATPHVARVPSESELKLRLVWKTKRQL